MLERIEAGLREEDRSNAEAWRDVDGRRRLRTLFELSDFARSMARKRGIPLESGPLEFPGLPPAAA